MVSPWEWVAVGAGIGSLATALVFIGGALVMLTLIAAGEERKR